MTARTAGRLVAVVDDDPRILRSLTDLLESADYSVRAFGSGRALLQSEWLPAIDCLISDIDMPAMDGFELVRLVDAARPGLPVILITGFPETLHRLPDPGGSSPRVFTKPFDASELLTAVSRVLHPGPR